jgi:hypothetical protein
MMTRKGNPFAARHSHTLRRAKIPYPYEIGGAKEDRTPDLLRARQALSQLSYSPNGVFYQSTPQRWWA